MKSLSASRGHTRVRHCGFNGSGNRQGSKVWLAILRPDPGSGAGTSVCPSLPPQQARAPQQEVQPALANRRECMLSTWRCQAKSPWLITRPDHVSAGFASYVSLRIYWPHWPLRHCDSFRTNDRVSRALSAIVGSEPWLCHRDKSSPDAPRSFAPSDRRAAHPPSSSA
jgi:hypothetical protein